MIELNITLLIQMVNFLVLVLIMDRLIFRPILGIIEKRDKHLEELKSKAVTFSEKAGEIQSEHDAQLAAIKREGTHIIDEIRKKGHEEQKEIVDMALENLDRKLKVAKDEIGREKEVASKRLQEETASIAMQLASKLLDRKIN
jgi:F-type H+-transporting ATPase subunit b